MSKKNLIFEREHNLHFLALDHGIRLKLANFFYLPNMNFDDTI